MVNSHLPDTRVWVRCLMSIAVLLSPITVACKTVETIETAIDATPSSATIPNLPKQTGLPVAPNGRNYPLVPKEPSEIAALITDIEAALITPQLAQQDLAALAHQQQVIYRVLSKRFSLRYRNNKFIFQNPAFTIYLIEEKQ